MSLLGLLRRGCHTRTNSPNGLVCDHNFAPVIDLFANSLQLSRIDSVGLAGFAFIQLLADAGHDVEILLERSFHLSSDYLV